MAQSHPLIVPGPVAYAVLGLSKRQFHRLVRDGLLPRAGKGKFDLYAIVPAFAAYLRDGRDTEPGMAAARLATERERARKLAFENEVKAGTLIYSDQVAEVLCELSADLARHLESLPGRHADELAALTERAAVRVRLLEITRGVRASFAAGIEKIADRLAKA